MRTKVYWTKDEVAECLHLAGKYFISAHGTWLSCLLEANATFPPDRRRAKATLMGLSVKYRALWNESRAEAIATTAAPPPAPDTPAEPVQQMTDGAVPSTPDPVAQLADALLGAVRSVMRDELRTLSAELTARLLAVQPSAPFASSDFPAAPPVWTTTSTSTSAARKPKVVLVGMIGQQISQIKQDYGAKFDIVAHEAGESNHLVAGRVAAADKVLVNTGKIGHPLYAALRARVPSERLVQFDGGVSSVRRILEAMV